MRYRSCESLLENRDKYKKKIEKISNRMIKLEKDIEAIKLKNVSPILSPKTIEKNTKNDIEEEKMAYLADNKTNNSSIYFQYNENQNDKFFIHNNSICNIHKSNSYSIISKEKLEYEYKLRILKRKLEKLKNKNKELNNELYNLKEKNDRIEINLSPYKNTYYEENKDDIQIGEIKDKNYRNKIKSKIIEICKKNNYYYNSYENAKNPEEYSLLNMLLNLMDIKYSYENAILYNSFLQGLDIILENNNYQFFNNPNEIYDYIKELINKEKKLKIANKKYGSYKKYYNLCKKFSAVENLDNFLNSIIMKNIKVEQNINKIKKVLDEENKYNGNSDINKRKILEQILNRNKDKSKYDFDKFSFYTTNYYNNKGSHHNHFNRNNNFIKKNKGDRQNNSNSAILVKNINNSNFNNYIRNNNKKYMNKKKESFSKTINNKNPKNFNKLFSYSISNNSKVNYKYNS